MLHSGKIKISYFRELLDRRKFAEALIRVLPQLQKNSTAISMAYSDVLQQYPVILSNKRFGDQTDRTDATTKPVSLLKNG